MCKASSGDESLGPALIWIPRPKYRTAKVRDKKWTFESIAHPKKLATSTRIPKHSGVMLHIGDGLGAEWQQKPQGFSLHHASYHNFIRQIAPSSDLANPPCSSFSVILIVGNNWRPSLCSILRKLVLSNSSLQQFRSADFSTILCTVCKSEKPRDHTWILTRVPKHT